MRGIKEGTTNAQLRDCPGSRLKSTAIIAGGTSNVGSGTSVSPPSSSVRVTKESVPSKSDVELVDEEKKPDKTEGERVCPEARRD